VTTQDTTHGGNQAHPIIPAAQHAIGEKPIVVTPGTLFYLDQNHDGMPPSITWTGSKLTVMNPCSDDASQSSLLVRIVFDDHSPSLPSELTVPFKSADQTTESWGIAKRAIWHLTADGAPVIIVSEIAPPKILGSFLLTPAKN